MSPSRVALLTLGLAFLAAGGGYAAATRDIDIILPAGALVRIVLTAPFMLEELI